MRGGAHRAERDGGFSLLEVLAASAMLLTCVAAVTLCVVSVTHAQGRMERVMDGDRAVRAVAQRLRLLPFCAAAYPRPLSAIGLEAGDLVAAVFPHAEPAENSDEARFLGADEPGAAAGSFVSLFEEGGRQVRCVAEFLIGAEGEPVAAAAVQGWTPAQGTPPGPALRVTLSSQERGEANAVVVVCMASAKLALENQTGGG